MQLQEYIISTRRFIEQLPYLTKPYSSRNWGHPWHSLCSYHGKLKPAIAHFLIKQFTLKGDLVLDPMCGVGTIPFEACLQGRIGIGNDLSELAYVVTTAKVRRPSKESVENVINELEYYIQTNKKQYDGDKIPYQDFGYNSKVPDYFHRDTYFELLAARDFFIKKMKYLTEAEAFVLSCLLHVLHGNRPYALSRNSHPLTPYAPTGPFVYKNVITHVRKKVILSFNKADFGDYTSGLSIHGDLFNLAEVLQEKVDAIITSPPFYDSLRFYVNNWLRLWFVGWEEENFSNADKIFLEGKQKKDLDIYISFFELCYKVLKPKGKLILHLGKTNKCDMAKELVMRAEKLFQVVGIGSETVENLEKHGIMDKGSTTHHQYLFLFKE